MAFQSLAYLDTRELNVGVFRAPREDDLNSRIYESTKDSVGISRLYFHYVNQIDKIRKKRNRKISRTIIGTIFCSK